MIPIPKALSSSVGRNIFYHCTGTISSSLFKRPEPDTVRVKPTEVEVTTLDHEIEGVETRSVLIKLDVEGAEPLALKGMRDMVKEAHSAIIFAELNPEALRAGQLTPEMLIDELQSLGLKILFIDEKARKLIPVHALSEWRKGNLLAWKGHEPLKWDET